MKKDLITTLLTIIVATAILFSMFSCTTRPGCKSTWGKVGYGDYKPYNKKF